MSCDIVAVTRHCPEDHATIVLVAHTAFSKPPDHVVPTTENKHIQTFGIRPLHVEGTVCMHTLLLAAVMYTSQNIIGV
jgi:hypothetical protein